jgi:sRNA-binding protein
MIELLFKLGPWIVGSLGLVVGAIFGTFRHQQAKTASAEAEAAKAQAARAVAQKQSEVDQGNAAASAAGEQAVINRAEADQTASTTAREDVDAELEWIGALRREQ